MVIGGSPFIAKAIAKNVGIISTSNEAVEDIKKCLKTTVEQVNK